MSLFAKLIEVEKTRFTHPGTVIQLDFGNSQYFYTDDYQVLDPRLISNLENRTIYPEEAQVYLDLMSEINDEVYKYLMNRVEDRMDELEYGTPAIKSCFAVSQKLYQKITRLLPSIQHQDLRSMGNQIFRKLKEFDATEETFQQRLKPKRKGYSITLLDDMPKPSKLPECVVGAGTSYFKDNTFYIRSAQPKSKIELPEIKKDFAKGIQGIKIMYVD